MLSIVPNKLLDSFVCSNCDKYFSVLPVTISQNFKKLCGRCTDTECDVSSNYNKLAEGMLFKCVNRYEGCLKLLFPSQVQEHEEQCISKSYECPLCVNEVIPSYKMVQHFRRHHSESVIEEAQFQINTSLDTHKTYMYNTDKHIFFIDVCIIHNELILKADCLGPEDHSKNLTYTFCMTKGNFIERFNCKICNQQRIWLHDGRYVVNCKLIVNYDLDKSMDMIQTGPCVQDKLPIDHQEIKELRRIYLDEDFLTKHVDWKLSPCKTLLVNKNDPTIIFTSSCSACGFLLCTSNIYYCFCPVKHFICDNCKLMKITCPGQYTCIELDRTLYNVFQEVKFYCKWQCKESFVLTELYDHEKKCIHRKLIICPVCYKCDIPNVDALINHMPMHESHIQILETNQFKLFYTYNSHNPYNLYYMRSYYKFHFYIHDLREYIIININTFGVNLKCSLEKSNLTASKYDVIVKVNDKIIKDTFEISRNYHAKLLITKDLF